MPVIVGEAAVGVHATEEARDQSELRP